jgi:membrane associated rhomboid family serine protease
MNTARRTGHWLSRDRLQDRLKMVGVFIAVLWIIQLSGTFFLNWFGDWKFAWGVVPRSLGGLPGIVTMHWVHDRLWTHLLPNTFPLAILLGLLALTRKNFVGLAALIAVLGATLLWLFGRPYSHIGASVLIYGLITFHIGTGFFERKPRSVIVAVVVGVLYWWTFFWGVLPIYATEKVSWDGHLCGALAGLMVAFALERPRWQQWPRRRLPDA